MKPSLIQQKAIKPFLEGGDLIAQSQSYPKRQLCNFCFRKYPEGKESYNYSTYEGISTSNI